MRRSIDDIVLTHQALKQWTRKASKAVEEAILYRVVTHESARDSCDEYIEMENDIVTLVVDIPAIKGGKHRIKYTLDRAEWRWRE